MKLITFEDIFSSSPRPPATILVEGEAGTLKSTLCFSMMLDMLKQPESFGLYMTFEQTWESHLANMKSLGYDPPPSLLSVDYNIMRREFGYEETHAVILNSILEMVASVSREKKGGLRIFALDSLNAVYSIMDRSFIEHSLVPFFQKLRQNNVISLIIHERTPICGCNCLRERFLADGIISLGILRNKGEAVRYLQALKYAGGEHSLKRRHLQAGRDGLSLLGTLYL
jgi:archaellum biogenesis ATPase FlaH